MRTSSIIGSTIFLLLVGPACSSTSDDGSGVANADLSKTPTHDESDRSCLVMLRTAAVNFDQVVTDKNGAQWASLTAEVNVMRGFAANAPTPGLMWIDSGGNAHTTNANNDPPTKIGGAPDGYQRFRFVLTHDTIQKSDSTLVRSAHVSIIPFVILPGNRRVFDHNRVTGDFDTYTLWSGDTAGGLVAPPPNNPEIGAQFQVKDADGVCIHMPLPEG
jgi:hypothetical protein